MPTGAPNEVISLGVSKEAALYFDRVFPDDMLVLSMDHAGIISGITGHAAPLGTPEMAAVARSLLPNTQGGEKLVQQYALLTAAIALLQFHWLRLPGLDVGNDVKRYLKTLDKGLNLGLDPEEAVDKRDNLVLERLDAAKQRLIRQAGFADSPTWVSEAFLDAPQASGDPKTENFALTMRGLHLVDPSKLTWDQICEFRNDEESRKALRELRLFFHDTFEGKDRAYISDKLLSLEDRHRRIAKLWGFETAQKSLSVAFTNQSVLMASAGALSATLAGAPLVATAAAGLVVPIGKVALEFTKALIDSAKTKSDNPVKYLTHLRRLAPEP